MRAGDVAGLSELGHGVADGGGANLMVEVPGDVVRRYRGSGLKIFADQNIQYCRSAFAEHQSSANAASGPSV